MCVCVFVCVCVIVCVYVSISWSKMFKITVAKQ